jgi:PPOX class probable F420-dependent enzyme
MELDHARELLASLHRAVMCTWRSDGSPQLSPVVCALDREGFVVVSTRETAMKTKNLRRDSRTSLCVMSDGFYGEWLQVDGRATVVALPEAMEELVDYYRRVAGEHPDWTAYRKAMADERRVLLKIAIERAGPDARG